MVRAQSCLFRILLQFPDVASDIKLGWLKARARAHRWKEELILVDEEMRRCLEYCAWKSNWWQSMANLRQCSSSSTRLAMPAALTEALNAYALEHSFTERRRLNRWKGTWEALRDRAAKVLEAKLGKTETGLDFEVMHVELPPMSDEIPEYIVADDEDDDLL
jgi:hypothetical protein